MSRFRNLEFGEQSEEPSRQEVVTKDEAYYLAQAQNAFEEGRFEQALRAYAKMLEFNSKSAVAWTGQVRVLIELGEFHEAKLWADKALETLPNEPELLAAKAVALGRMGDLKGALAFSDAAIEERGNTPYVWLARGDVLLARREKRADSCFEKALALAAFDWFYLWLTSRIYFYYRQFAQSLKLAQQALEVNALRAAVWLQVGRSQLALGLVNQAESSFAQARELDPACQAADAHLAGSTRLGVLARLRGLWRRHFGS
jgi:tetratricopeptide (TPR) repeat protein